MEMDLVEIVELTGVDTFKCVDFREAFVEHSESPVRTRTQRPRLAPQRHPTHFSQENRALPRKTFIYQGEEMKQRTNHLVTALSVSFCPSLSPSSFSSPSLSFALLSLLSPFSIFVCLFPWLRLLLFDLPLPLFTFPAVCGCAEIEDSLKCVCHCQGSGEGRARGAVCMHLADGSILPGFLIQKKCRKFPWPFFTMWDRESNFETFWTDEGLGPWLNGQYLCFWICFLTTGQRSVQSPS